MVSAKLTVTQDFTKEFTQLVARYKNDAVLVGIPAEDSAREDGEDIGNAAILAIHHFGSPANNLPARQPLTTGIRNAQDPIADEYKKAAQLSLKQGLSALDRYYERAGIIASNAVKKAINDQEDIAPLAPSTLAARASSGFRGDKALVRSGQLRNAITYIVKRFGS